MQASKSGAIALDAKTAGGDNSNELVWRTGDGFEDPPLRQRHKCCAASQSDTASISASVSSANRWPSLLGGRWLGTSTYLMLGPRDRSPGHPRRPVIPRRGVGPLEK